MRHPAGHLVPEVVQAQGQLASPAAQIEDSTGRRMVTQNQVPRGAQDPLGVAPAVPIVHPGQRVVGRSIEGHPRLGFRHRVRDHGDEKVARASVATNAKR